MRQSGSSTLIAVLCVAILFVFMTTPSRESASASMKAEVASVESVAQTLAKSIEQQQLMNVKAAEADIALVDKMNALFSHVSQLQSSFGNLRESVKLTSAAVQNDKCDCTCGEKLAELQKQIDNLKSRVATLEQPTAASKSTTSAAAASSYGTAPATKSTSTSGGSTGSVKSGGSTGSATVVKSGGSTGSAVYVQPVVSTSGSHWTYPGSIDSHLAGTHGVNVAGMSTEQMLSLHDALHEGRATAPVPQATFVQQVQMPTRSFVPLRKSQTSQCPPGGCPQQGSLQSTRGGGLLGFGILGR